jgi:hypothetical protein
MAVSLTVAFSLTKTIPIQVIVAKPMKWLKNMREIVTKAQDANAQN